MFILAKKVKMTQLWKENRAVPVTVVSAASNTVSQIRTKEKDGYTAVQVKFGKAKREFRVSEEGTLKTGDAIEVSVFEKGDKIDVSGIMKGRGFQGTVKRHGFHGGPRTHCQKNRLRAPGSIGSTAPQRVVPGRRMAGRMGGTRVTVKGLKIVSIDKDNKTISIKGAIPGAKGSMVEIRKSKHNSNVTK